MVAEVQLGRPHVVLHAGVCQLRDLERKNWLMRECVEVMEQNERVTTIDNFLGIFSHICSHLLGMCRRIRCSLLSILEIRVKVAKDHVPFNISVGAVIDLRLLSFCFTRTFAIARCPNNGPPILRPGTWSSLLNGFGCRV